MVMVKCWALMNAKKNSWKFQTLDLERKHFPLIITFHKFLLMLDGTLMASYFDKYCCSKEFLSVEKGTPKYLALQALIRSKEVNFDRFVGSYWPHFSTQLTKKLDPSIVFTEIISHIKGGLVGEESYCSALGREGYIVLCDKRTSILSMEKRERIYDIFIEYEKKKLVNEEFDLSDLVNDLHRRLQCCGYCGDGMDFIYVDEVQDLTMRQVSLFKEICSNFKEGYVFAGDTAQTISRGIDFRFEDLRCLFYRDFHSSTTAGECGSSLYHGRKRNTPDLFQLVENFRTHAGVLQLSQSIIDLIYEYFPFHVDKLTPETSLIYGEAPMLIESGDGEDTIMNIFGRGMTCNLVNGFGADQAILVRDESEKRKILELIGKQALVLTISECKGLEFQDLLLCNFFGTSPLKRQWRVIYGFMEAHEITHSEQSFPSFDDSRHGLLCSELKQLYVGVTRTRQRLWISETRNDYCQPIFDYWKRLCLVQVRQFDSSLAEAMQTASTSDEWRYRGIKLFNVGNFEMATMCFERAGDEFREKWAKAAGHRATADRIISVNLKMGQLALRKAVEIYDSIGKSESSAACFIAMKDFETAGRIYLEKCGPSKLVDAADCFERGQCRSLAAESFAKAKLLSKCLDCCTRGELFDMGLSIVEQQNYDLFSDGKNFNEIRQSYLESAALHFYRLGETKHMMSFVKTFNSMDSIQTFLKAKNILDELITVEIELGNYHEAANVCRMKGDILLEAEMLEKACDFEKSSQLLMFYVVTSSLWSSGGRGWPFMNIMKMEEIITKAKSAGKRVSRFCSDSISLEADFLASKKHHLRDLSKYLVASREFKNVRLEIFCLRTILDIHIQEMPSKFILEPPEINVEKAMDSEVKKNSPSIEMFLECWSSWREHSVKVLSCIRSIESPEDSNLLKYEDFCHSYFGVRKYGSESMYVVIHPEARWFKFCKELSSHENLVMMTVKQFSYFAHHFWVQEFVSVSMEVLGKLESLLSSASEGCISAIPRARIILGIYEVAKFLVCSNFIDNRKILNEAKSYVSHSHENLKDAMFPSNWGTSVVEDLSGLRKNGLAREVLDGVLVDNIRPKDGHLSHKQVGTIAMLFLVTGKLDEERLKRSSKSLSQLHSWDEFL